MGMGPCTRITKAGAPCKSGQVTWYRSEMADPEACISHLTAEERTELKAINARFDAEFVQPWLAQEAALFNADPACWSWKPPTADDLAAVKESYSEAVRAVLADDDWPAILMGQWQDGRCAICGTKGALVEDHDHQTGLVRGDLCRSCNTCEGFRSGGVWDKYRERNPASICGIRERYWHPIEKKYAEPRPTVTYDRWKDHPLKGVL